MSNELAFEGLMSQDTGVVGRRITERVVQLIHHCTKCVLRMLRNVVLYFLPKEAYLQDIEDGVHGTPPHTAYHDDVEQ